MEKTLTKKRDSLTQANQRYNRLFEEALRQGNIPVSWIRMFQSYPSALALTIRRNPLEGILFLATTPILVPSGLIASTILGLPSLIKKIKN